MLFATLPGPVFAQVVHWLYPQETCWIRDPQSRYADGGGRGKHNAKAMLQCFSLLSKTLHALVRQTPELYFYSKTLYWGQLPTYHSFWAWGAHNTSTTVASHLCSHRHFGTLLVASSSLICAPLTSRLRRSLLSSKHVPC